MVICFKRSCCFFTECAQSKFKKRRRGFAKKKEKITEQNNCLKKVVDNSLYVSYLLYMSVKTVHCGSIMMDCNFSLMLFIFTHSTPLGSSGFGTVAEAVFHVMVCLEGKGHL